MGGRAKRPPSREQISSCLERGRSAWKGFAYMRLEGGAREGSEEEEQEGKEEGGLELKRRREEERALVVRTTLFCPSFRSSCCPLLRKLDSPGAGPDPTLSASCRGDRWNPLGGGGPSCSTRRFERWAVPSFFLLTLPALFSIASRHLLRSADSFSHSRPNLDQPPSPPPSSLLSNTPPLPPPSPLPSLLERTTEIQSNGNSAGGSLMSSSSSIRTRSSLKLWEESGTALSGGIPRLCELLLHSFLLHLELDRGTTETDSRSLVSWSCCTHSDVSRASDISIQTYLRTAPPTSSEEGSTGIGNQDIFLGGVKFAPDLDVSPLSPSTGFFSLVTDPLISSFSHYRTNALTASSGTPSPAERERSTSRSLSSLLR